MGHYCFDKAKRDTDYTWQTFGRELIKTGDLDPIYVILAECHSLDEKTLLRWLVCYFCYYDASVASRVAEYKGDAFYDQLTKGIGEKWPHGMERRHFWGKTAYNCISGLQEYGEPERVADRMMQHDTFEQVSKATRAFNGFGPWMAWKIADVAERVLHYPVDFTNTSLAIYKDPQQGAAMIAHGDWRHPITEEVLNIVVKDQLRQFADLMAPPYYDRPINIQEVETNLCKFKAHYKHHYPMGNDTHHIRQALEKYPSDIGQDLMRWLPQ